MEKHEKLKLQGKRPFIVENLKEIAKVVDALYTTRTLSPYEKEDIECQRTSFGKVRIMLDHLERKPGAYSKFLDAIWDAGQDDMVAEIDAPYANRKRSCGGVSGQNELTASSQQGNSGTTSLRSGTSGAPMSTAVAERRNKIYPLIHTHHHGFALIINNKIFNSPDPQKPLKIRTGTDLDQEDLKILFTRLGFKPIVQRDLSAEKMKSIIETYANDDLHVEYECFICAILSHGEDDYIYGVDGKTVKVEDDIIEPIQSCRSLKGKPKLFFLQACRGGYTDMIEEDGAESDASRLDDVVPLCTSAPEFADVLIAYPTARGYVSMRDTTRGSWFIQSLVTVLSLPQMSEYHILELLTQVNEEVALRTGRLTLPMDGQVTVRAVANFWSSLRKYLFFNPLK